MISFVIPILPTAQMRARHCARKLNSGKVFSKTYKAPEQARNEAQLMQLLERYVPERPIEGPIALSVQAFLPIPRSWPKWKQEAAVFGYIYPTGKPDLDNLIKNIKDCMTKLGFWHDDCQIVDYMPTIESGSFVFNNHPLKKYSLSPHWKVLVEEIKQPRTSKEFAEMRVRQEYCR